jgi:hypothetical protein
MRRALKVLDSALIPRPTTVTLAAAAMSLVLAACSANQTGARTSPDARSDSSSRIDHGAAEGRGDAPARDQAIVPPLDMSAQDALTLDSQATDHAPPDVVPGCTSDCDCTDPMTPTCNTSTGACVQCLREAVCFSLITCETGIPICTASFTCACG